MVDVGPKCREMEAARGFKEKYLKNQTYEKHRKQRKPDLNKN